MVSSNEEIELFFTHFQQLFLSSSLSKENADKGTHFVKRKVLEEMNFNLTKHFVKEEVEWPLKQMAHLKSLGPDGFNPSFYQKY